MRSSRNRVCNLHSWSTWTTQSNKSLGIFKSSGKCKICESSGEEFLEDEAQPETEKQKSKQKKTKKKKEKEVICVHYFALSALLILITPARSTVPSTDSCHGL